MSGDHKILLKGHSSQYLKLNVGGHLYYTTIGTLTKNNDTMLSAMFSGRMEVLTDSEGLLHVLIRNNINIQNSRMDFNRSLWKSFWYHS